MSTTLLVAAISLMAALPQSAAQSKVTILTGSVGAQAVSTGAMAAGTGSMAKPAGSVVSINVAGGVSGAAAATGTGSAAKAAGSVVTINVAGGASGAAVATGTGTAAKPAGSVVTINVAGGVNATGTATGSTSRASGTAGSQNVWVIKVGSGGLTFSPNTISGAQVGDLIQFQFYTGNHSVVMGDYNNACAPVAASNVQAFFSGFMATQADGQLTYTVPVKTTDPMWMYCAQAKHCQEGMVAVVNPPTSGQTLTDYKQRAAQAQNNVVPSGAATGGTSGSGTSTTGKQSGQIGGSTTTAGPAKQTNANAASSIRTTSILGLAGIAAMVVLFL